MSTESEIELCYFAEIKKPEGLNDASGMEIHEQYEYRIPPGENGERRGRTRVRKTTKNNESTYVQTIKSPTDENSLLGDIESNVDISEPFYNAWLSTYRVTGQRKIRYFFVSNNVTMKYQGNEIKLPPVKFEVDIFLDAKGRKSKWAKIDIEVQDIVAFLKNSYENVDAAQFEIMFDCLPLDIGQVVSAATKNSDERAAIDNFFKMYSIPYEVANDRAD